jgi:lysophospholipase L1-like esterase
VPLAAAVVLASRLLAPEPSSLDVVVFLDENGNGALDPDERGRVPGASVSIDAATARSAPGTGRARVSGIGDGSHELSLRPESLPPFYRAPAPRRIQVPAAVELAVPTRLPIAANRPHVYLAFGDSLTEGVGSSDGTAYRRILESRLSAHFGRATVVDGGGSGTDSHRGARRVAGLLAAHRPAYTLVLYGINDWDREDRGRVTLRSLGRILDRVAAAGSLPVLATLPPTHPGADPRASLERNRWVSHVNEGIRRLAAARGAALADVEAALLSRTDRDVLYYDGLHPNDAGYAVVAEAFFAAISGRPPSRGGALQPACYSTKSRNRRFDATPSMRAVTSSVPAFFTFRIGVNVSSRTSTSERSL